MDRMSGSPASGGGAGNTMAGNTLNDEKLNRLFAEYRETVTDPEPSPYFMPKLWQRIEARRPEPLSIFKRMAQVCVMTTLALALLMSVIGPELQKDPGVTGSYVDVLA